MMTTCKKKLKMEVKELKYPEKIRRRKRVCSKDGVSGNGGVMKEGRPKKMKEKK